MDGWMVLLERERLLEESELRLASVPPGPAFDVASYASALLPLRENIPILNCVAVT